MTKAIQIVKALGHGLAGWIPWEWMFGDLSEERITEIGKTQFPSDQMTAYTIAKDFKEQLEPAKPFVYEDLPEIASVL